MTSELRPAVEVWRQAHQALYWLPKGTIGEQGAAAVIEADREAVRAEMRQALIATGEAAATHLKELAKFKALAETLAVALEGMQSYGCPVCNGDCGSANPPVIFCPMTQCGEALRQYKEARDAS